MADSISRQINDAQGVAPALSWMSEMTYKALKDGPVLVTLGRPKRSSQANALMWVLLTEFAAQVPMWIDGEEVTASQYDWKHVMSAALAKHQRVARGLDGGLVFLGQSTSKMSKAQFSDLIELIYQAGAEREVKFSDPALAEYQKWIDDLKLNRKGE